mgnify:CR=1 FL=1
MNAIVKCKENLVLTTVVSLGAYFVFLFGFLTGVFLFRLIGGGMAIALLVGKAILFKRKSNTKKRIHSVYLSIKVDTKMFFFNSFV